MDLIKIIEYLKNNNKKIKIYKIATLSKYKIITYILKNILEKKDQ